MTDRRLLSAEEVAELRKIAVPNINISMRQAVGGYIVNGAIAWSKDGDLVAQQTDEGLASSLPEALLHIDSYFNNYTFEVPKKGKE